MAESQLLFNLKFNGKEIMISSLHPDQTVADLKNEIFSKTNVLQETQKILGLKTSNNAPITDDLKLSHIVLKPNTKLMLIGSTQEAIGHINAPVQNVPEVIDDFDFKEDDVKICQLPENLEKVKRRSKAYRARKLCDPRPGKNLLVLDVDYTIFDHLSPAESVRELARPYLHKFLTRAYVNFDIAIWSATSLTWILAKLGQLGVIPLNANAILRQQNSMNNYVGPGNEQGEQTTLETSLAPNGPSVLQSNFPEPPFRICLLLDSSDMISVHFPLYGVKEVKPLAVIWDNHSQWGPHNTIMFDDIRRNFIMNPENGLRIRSYRDAHVNNKTDCELRGLARYLELISVHEENFASLHHSRWERYIAKHKHKFCKPKQARYLDNNELHLHDSSTTCIPSSTDEGIHPATEVGCLDSRDKESDSDVGVENADTSAAIPKSGLP